MMAATDYLTKTEKVVIAVAARREATTDQVKDVLKQLRHNNVVDAVIAAVVVEDTIEEIKRFRGVIDAGRTYSASNLQGVITYDCFFHLTQNRDDE